MKASMVFKMILPIIFGLGLGMNAGAADSPTEKEVLVGVNDAYIPGGFDANSDVYVVTSGIFPNSCYKWSRADVGHMAGNIHEVRSLARVNQGMCLMVLVPFTKEVQLGQIGSGQHTVRFINGDGTYWEKGLVIE